MFLWSIFSKAKQTFLYKLYKTFKLRANWIENYLQIKPTFALTVHSSYRRAEWRSRRQRTDEVKKRHMISPQITVPLTTKHSCLTSPRSLTAQPYITSTCSFPLMVKFSLKEFFIVGSCIHKNMRRKRSTSSSSRKDGQVKHCQFRSKKSYFAFAFKSYVRFARQESLNRD